MKKKFVSMFAGIFLLAVFPIGSVEAKEIVRFGSDVVVGKNMTVEKVVVIGGNITVKGIVKEEVVAIGGDIFLGPRARVGNEVVAIGGAIQKEEGAQVLADEVEMNIPGLSSFIGFASRTNWLGWKLAFKMLTFIGFLALAILTVAIIPRPFDLITTNVQKNWLHAILWGILGLVVLIPLGIFLVITVIGIPLVVLEVFVAGCLLFVGYVAVAQVIGNKIAGLLKRPALSILWVMLLGLITLWMISWVPFLGWLVKAVVLVLGFGAVLASIFSSTGRYKGERAL